MKNFKMNPYAKFYLVPLLSLTVVGCSNNDKQKENIEVSPVCPRDLGWLLNCVNPMDLPNESVSGMAQPKQDNGFLGNKEKLVSDEDYYDLESVFNNDVVSKDTELNKDEFEDFLNLEKMLAPIYGEAYENFYILDWRKFLLSRLDDYKALVLQNTSKDDHSKEYSMIANLVVFNAGMSQVNQLLDKVSSSSDDNGDFSEILFPEKLVHGKRSNYGKDLKSTYNAVKKIGYKGNIDDWAKFVDQQRIKANLLLQKDPCDAKPLLVVALATWVNVGNRQFAKSELVKDYENSKNEDDSSGDEQPRSENSHSLLFYHVLYSMLMSGNTRVNTSNFTPYKDSSSVLGVKGGKSNISKVSSAIRSTSSSTSSSRSSSSISSQSSSSVSRGGFGGSNSSRSSSSSSSGSRSSGG